MIENSARFCEECNGTGHYYQWVQDVAQHERLACPECEGTGITRM